MKSSNWYYDLKHRQKTFPWTSWWHHLLPPSIIEYRFIAYMQVGIAVGANTPKLQTMYKNRALPTKVAHALNYFCSENFKTNL